MKKCSMVQRLVSLIMAVALLVGMAACSSGPVETGESSIEEINPEDTRLDDSVPVEDDSDSDDTTPAVDAESEDSEIESISFSDAIPNSGEVELGEGFIRNADGSYAFGGTGGEFYVPDFNVDARTAVLVEEDVDSGSTYVPYALHGDIAGFIEWADTYGVDLSDQESVRAYNNAQIALIEETTGAKVNEQTTLNLVNTALTKVHNSITAEASNNTTGHAAVFQAVMMYPYSCNSDANIPMIQGWTNPSNFISAVAYWVLNGGEFGPDFMETGRYNETVYQSIIDNGFYMVNQRNVNVLILNHLDASEQGVEDGINVEYIALVDVDGTVGYALFGRQESTWHCLEIYSM